MSRLGIFLCFIRLQIAFIWMRYQPGTTWLTEMLVKLSAINIWLYNPERLWFNYPYCLIVIVFLFKVFPVSRQMPS